MQTSRGEEEEPLLPLDGHAAKRDALAGTAALVVAYLALNSSLNMLNKWALGIFGFSFPLFMTTCHMAFSFFALLPYMLSARMRDLHEATLAKQWKGLVCVGVFLAINIGLNNLSLVEISLSLNQVIRSAIPVVTAVLAVGVEKQVPSRLEGSALCILTAGVMLACAEGALRGSAYGIAICLLGTLSNALMMTMSGRVMSEKLDVLRLTFYTSPISCLVLLPFCWFKEAERLVAYTAAAPDPFYVAIIGAGCVNALAYNVVHYLMIQRTSAVTTTVLGEVKIAGLLLLSAAFLGETSIMSARMITGCALAMAGFCLYSHARMARSRARPTSPAPPPPSLPAKGGGIAEGRLLEKLDAAAGMNGVNSRNGGGTIKAHRPGRD